MTCIGKSYDMKINVNKVKTMKFSTNEGAINIIINGQKVEQVSKFKYLRAWIAEAGSNEPKIKTTTSSRLRMAKDAFSKRKELLTP